LFAIAFRATIARREEDNNAIAQRGAPDAAESR
jgi:hypothetical protein